MSTRSSFLFLLVAALLAGCGGPSVAMKCVIAGGETKIFQMRDSGPEQGEDDHMKVESAGFFIQQEAKKVAFAFSFLTKKQAKPTKVVIEDVSDETAVLLLTDLTPSLDEKGSWKGKTGTYETDHSSVAWIIHEGNTVRVYKFTVDYADGKKTEVYQPSMVPLFGKMMIKAQLGIK